MTIYEGAGIVAAIGVLFTFANYILARKRFKVEKQFRSKENAARLLSRYPTLLKKITFIGMLMGDQGKIITTKIEDHISARSKDCKNCKKKCKAKKCDLMFTSNEMKEIFKDLSKPLRSYKASVDWLKSYVLIDAYIKIFGYDKALFDAARVIESLYKKKEDLKFEDLDANLQFTVREIKQRCRAMLTDTLNELEEICMNFYFKIADGDVAWYSMYQTYLPFISLVYPEISSFNDKLRAEYYTNVIDIYNLWNKKYRHERRLDKVSNVMMLYQGGAIKEVADMVKASESGKKAARVIT